MTKEEFETYRFTVKTRIMIHGVWHKITEVDFSQGKIGVDSGYFLGYDEYEAIREEK